MQLTNCAELHDSEEGLYEQFKRLELINMTKYMYVHVISLHESPLTAPVF